MSYRLEGGGLDRLDGVIEDTQDISIVFVPLGIEYGQRVFVVFRVGPVLQTALVDSLKLILHRVRYPVAEVLVQGKTDSPPVALNDSLSNQAIPASEHVRLAIVRSASVGVVPPQHNGRSFLFDGNAASVRFMDKENVGEDVEEGLEVVEVVVWREWTRVRIRVQNG